MTEHEEKWDRQWHELLSRCGAPVDAKPGFKAGLLAKLKDRQQALSGEEGAASEIGRDEQWSRLLTATRTVCEPRPAFQHALLDELRRKQQSLASGGEGGEGEEAAMQTLLTSAYCPVEARREFQDRLLDNLKERQRTTIRFRRESRRRSIFASFASSIAAAAAVLFVVWAGPFGGLDNRNPAPASGVEVAENIGAGIARANEETIPAVRESEPSVAIHQPDMAANIVPAVATEGDWKVASAFAGDALPAKALATGLEYNDGHGWQTVDESSYVGITPGLAFRSARPTSAGLGFSDGSTILIPPDSEVEATSRGFALRRGGMAVSVPQDAKNELRLDFPTHDVSVVPGTLLAVSTSSSPDEFADGGAPAPEIMVADGGLALARGKAGIGPMLAGNVYQLDNYVTPDLPSRPICNAERKQMEEACSVPSDAPVRIPAPAAGNRGMNQLVSMPSASGISPSPAGFVRDGDRWVPKGYTGQETTKIKYLSDAYFSLVNSRRDLAPALSLGGAVVVNAGDGVFYEITKK